jgi:hypothetical protein
MLQGCWFQRFWKKKTTPVAYTRGLGYFPNDFFYK